MATSIQSKVWSHVNGWWDLENWKVIHAVTCSSDPVWMVKHANRWGIIKIEKLQRLFEPEGCSKQGKQVGVLKIEKQQMQIVDPSKPCKYREGTRNEHHKWNRWPWVHPRKGICFVGSWSWVPALQLWWVLFVQKHLSKALRGGCLISFFRLHCFYLRQLFHGNIYSK